MAGRCKLCVVLVAMCGAVVSACDAGIPGDGASPEISVMQSALLTGPIVLDQTLCGQTGAICVNFQLGGAPVPSGYLPDTGAVFGSRSLVPLRIF
jgi:hypothetical protein